MEAELGEIGGKEGSMRPAYEPNPTGHGHLSRRQVWMRSLWLRLLTDLSGPS